MKNSTGLLSIAWRTVLTNNQRSAWSLYAANIPWLNKLGQGCRLTGLQHYIRSNAPRIQCGATRIDDGPTIFNLSEPEQEFDFNPAVAAGKISISFRTTVNNWTRVNNAHLIIYQGKPRGPSIKFFKGPYRFMARFDGSSPGGVNSPKITDLIYSAVAGHQIWLRCRVSEADGRLSEFAQANHVLI